MEIEPIEQTNSNNSVFEIVKEFFRNLFSTSGWLGWLLSEQGFIGALYHDSSVEDDDPSIQQLLMLTSVFCGPFMLYLGALLIFIAPANHYKYKAWGFWNGFLGVIFTLYILANSKFSDFAVAVTPNIAIQSSENQRIPVQNMMFIGSLSDDETLEKSQFTNYSLYKFIDQTMTTDQVLISADAMKCYKKTEKEKNCINNQYLNLNFVDIENEESYMLSKDVFLFFGKINYSLLLIKKNVTTNVNKDINSKKKLVESKPIVCSENKNCLFESPEITGYALVCAKDKSKIDVKYGIDLYNSKKFPNIDLLNIKSYIRFEKPIWCKFLAPYNHYYSLVGIIFAI